MGGLLDDGGARVVVLVDPVAEAHEPDAVLLVLDLADELGCGHSRALDRVQHPQDGLVRAAVQRAGQGAHARGHGGVHVGVGRSHEAHRGGRAVLLVVGVQDEQHVQGPHHGRVDVVGLVGHAEGQTDEVLDVGALRVGVEQRQADGAPGDVADHRRQLGQQQYRGELALVGVVRIEGVLVVGGQARDPRLEDRHRVTRGGEGGEEAAEVLV